MLDIWMNRNCQNPTQRQLNDNLTKVGFDMKMTLVHRLSSGYSVNKLRLFNPKLNVSSIAAVTDLDQTLEVG